MLTPQAEMSGMRKEDQMAHLHQLLVKRMLRRGKADLPLAIPQKMESIVCVDLSSEQRELYKLILARNYHVFLSHLR